MGVASTVAPKGPGPQDPTKNLAHLVDLLDQPLTRKLVFQNFGPDPLLNTVIPPPQKCLYVPF